MSYINGFSSSCNLDNIEEMKLKCRRWGSMEWDLLCEKHHYYMELSLVGSSIEVNLSIQIPTTIFLKILIMNNWKHFTWLPTIVFGSLGLFINHLISCIVKC
jgi:hypothetical protein